MSPRPVGRPPLSDEHGTVRISVRMTSDLLQRLNARMLAEERPYSEILRDALEAYLPSDGHLICNCPDCKRPDHERLTGSPD